MEHPEYIYGLTRECVFSGISESQSEELIQAVGNKTALFRRDNDDIFYIHYFELSGDQYFLYHQLEDTPSVTVPDILDMYEAANILLPNGDTLGRASFTSLHYFE